MLRLSVGLKLSWCSVFYGSINFWEIIFLFITEKNVKMGGGVSKYNWLFWKVGFSDPLNHCQTLLKYEHDFKLSQNLKKCNKSIQKSEGNMECYFKH